ncbi:MAG: extracellular solute-binding protein [Bacillota bacterium]|nr:extracellular solute-binding protein [Bacillota bacterium]
MKRRKYLRIAAMVLVSLFVFFTMSSCKQTDTSTTGTTKAPTSTTTKSATTTTEAPKYPEYLNLDGYYPIVKEGQTVKLSVGVGKNDNPAASDPEDLWLFNYLTEYMNIEFEFTTILKSAWGQQKALLFASGELFDVAYGLRLSPIDITLYGQEEGQLMALNDYINPELTPAMQMFFDEKPVVKAYATAADGFIYTIPFNSVSTYTTSTAASINEAELERNNLSVPYTLDEFMELMRAWKKLYPDSTPVSGGYTSAGPMKLILSALGVVMETGSGADMKLEYRPALRNGSVIIPAAEKEVYTEYINVMKALYDENLVSQDFFTMDGTARNAQLASGKSILLHGSVYTALPDTFKDWQAMVPLTSKFNDTPVWDAHSPVTIGDVWLSSTCPYPEVVVRWFDWYFTDQGCVYMWLGPMEGQEETMDRVIGWFFDEAVGAINSKAFTEGKHANLFEYYIAEVSPGNVAGNYASIYRARLEMAGQKWTSDIDALDPTTGDNYAQISAHNKLRPHVINGFPHIIYIDSDTATKLADLETLLSNYIANQSARFITGDRPLSELNAFFTELDGLGVEEYRSIYEEVYNNYVTAFG